jgi:glyoxylase-like metal-dependent hydrolase (beta-lactamase superfamily II)
MGGRGDLGAGVESALAERRRGHGLCSDSSLHPGDIDTRPIIREERDAMAIGELQQRAPEVARGGDHGATFEVVPDVAGVSLSLANAYLIGPPGAPDRGWLLVDAGVTPFSAGPILGAAAARFGQRSRPAAIALTHGHFDHVGALGELAGAWDAPILAHRMEHPYLDGRSPYPPPDPAVGGLMSFLSRFYPRGPIDVGPRLRDLPADGRLPGPEGWRWLPTPGHSPGHVSFFRDADRTLIAGDAFVTTNQESAFALMTGETHVHRPPGYYTCDWDWAKRSVEALRALRPEVAATGHGRPMRGPDLLRQLDALIENWDAEGQPAYGRYARRPAVTDEGGFVSAPPSVFDYKLLAAAGVALVGMAAWQRLRR